MSTKQKTEAFISIVMRELKQAERSVPQRFAQRLTALLIAIKEQGLSDAQISKRLTTVLKNTFGNELVAEAKPETIQTDVDYILRLFLREATRGRPNVLNKTRKLLEEAGLQHPADSEEPVQVGKPAARALIPLEFHLWNSADQPVLSTLDPAGQALNLHVRNVAGKAIAFRDPGPAVTGDNAHIVIRFRKGSLKELVTEPAPPGWSLAASRNGTEDQLLLRSQKDLALAPDEQITILLPPLQGDPEGGTRFTRVAFGYQNLHLAGMTEDSPGLTGLNQHAFTVAQLDSDDARGQVGSPLAASFVSDNVILADGASPSTLIVRLTNVADDDRIVAIPKEGITLQFDYERTAGENPAALCRNSEAATIEVTITGPNNRHWGSWDRLSTGAPEWSFPSTNRSTRRTESVPVSVDQGVRLAPGESALINIAGIMSSSQKGSANLRLVGADLTVDDDPIPDHTWVLTVEKSPLAFMRVGQLSTLAYDRPNRPWQLGTPGARLIYDRGTGAGSGGKEALIFAMGVEKPLTIEKTAVEIQGDLSVKSDPNASAPEFKVEAGRLEAQYLTLRGGLKVEEAIEGKSLKLGDGLDAATVTAATLSAGEVGVSGSLTAGATTADSLSVQNALSAGAVTSESLSVRKDGHEWSIKPGSANSSHLAFSLVKNNTVLDLHNEGLNVKGVLGTDGLHIGASGGMVMKRIVSGTVGSSGDILAGKGFSIDHIGEGKYRVTFDVAYAHTPIVAATAYGGDVRASVPELKNTDFVVAIQNYKHRHNDGFHFIAIESDPLPAPVPPQRSYDAVAAPEPSYTPVKRMVSGTVRGDGHILSGTGFSVLHRGEGKYWVEFNRAYAHKPIVMATAYGGDANASVIRLENTHFEVGIQKDSEFHFIAIESDPLPEPIPPERRHFGLEAFRIEWDKGVDVEYKWYMMDEKAYVLEYTSPYLNPRESGYRKLYIIVENTSEHPFTLQDTPDKWAGTKMALSPRKPRRVPVSGTGTLRIITRPFKV